MRDRNATVRAPGRPAGERPAGPSEEALEATNASGVRTVGPAVEAAVHARVVIAAEATLGRRVVSDAGTIGSPVFRGGHRFRPDKQGKESAGRKQ